MWLLECTYVQHVIGALQMLRKLGWWWWWWWYVTAAVRWRKTPSERCACGWSDGEVVGNASGASVWTAAAVHEWLRNIADRDRCVRRPGSPAMVGPQWQSPRLPQRRHFLRPPTSPAVSQRQPAFDTRRRQSVRQPHRLRSVPSRLSAVAVGPQHLQRSDRLAACPLAKWQ